jgi:hypothetical protein
MSDWDDDVDSDEGDTIDDKDVFDLTTTKFEAWQSKDRRHATIRIRDDKGLCDFKILLILREKLHQMEKDLGLHDEHGERH